MPTVPARRAEIRRELRARRAALDADEQAAAAIAVATRVARLHLAGAGDVVAGYRAVRGELDVDPLLAVLAEQGSLVTVPVVVGDTLEFVVADLDDRGVPGPHGVPEPASGTRVPVADHAVVLVPLVAFDDAGRRLGQGGGHYDRALAPLPPRPRRRPLLVGVAHAFQQVAEVPAEPWDVPLDLVVTEEGVVGEPPGR